MSPVFAFSWLFHRVLALCFCYCPLALLFPCIQNGSGYLTKLIIPETLLFLIFFAKLNFNHNSGRLTRSIVVTASENTMGCGE